MYVTQSGDEWDKISLKVYGSEKYVGELLKANESLSGEMILSGGLELETPTVKADTLEEFKPKWKR